MPPQIRNPKQLVSDSYDRIATRYLEWRAQQHDDGAIRWVTILREYLPDGAKVLDLGCGAGSPLTRSLAQSFSVTGVDISSHQIELARSNVMNARFVHADMTTLDFDPESFDAAVASYSFIHVPRAEHAPLFRKIQRWLRPGGLLLANFGVGNCEEDYDNDWLGAPMFWSSFDAKGERSLLQSSGFSFMMDRVETEIEDGRPLRWLVVLAHT